MYAKADEFYTPLKVFFRRKLETEPVVRVKKLVNFWSTSVVDFETVVTMEAQRPTSVREMVRARMTNSDAWVDGKADEFYSRLKGFTGCKIGNQTGSTGKKVGELPVLMSGRFWDAGEYGDAKVGDCEGDGA